MSTAHPHHDRQRGECFSYEIDLIPPTGLRVLSERRGVRRELAFIPQERPGYLHSFGLTDRYVVSTQPWGSTSGASSAPTADRSPPRSSGTAPQPSRILLVDRRRGGVAATFELDSAFVFHHINAFEDGDRVILDVCAHRDSSIVDAMYLENVRKPGARIPQAVARRLTVEPGRPRVRQRDLAEGNFELPRVDYSAVNGRRYRYAYGVGVRHPRRSGFIDRLVKLDVRRGEQLGWQDHGAYPGEPIFVRRPGGRREDDGVLLSVVLDGRRRTSYLLVLDARDMSELARAAVPHHIPCGFHGIHSARA